MHNVFSLLNVTTAAVLLEFNLNPEALAKDQLGPAEESQFETKQLHTIEGGSQHTAVHAISKAGCQPGMVASNRRLGPIL